MKKSEIDILIETGSSKGNKLFMVNVDIHAEGVEHMDKQGIEKFLLENGNIKFGNFTLASGKKSDYYVDVKSALLNPTFLKEVSKRASQYITGQIIAAVELGAVPLGVGVSLETGKNLVIIRKERKEHGLGKAFEGDVGLGETVTFVEDVTTTGGSILRAVRVLNELHARTDRVVVIVDRKEGAKEALELEGIELVSLVDIDEIKKGST